MSDEPAALAGPGRRSFRQASLLGYHLSQAHGYRVWASDGSEIGVLHDLRYERYADYPDQLLVRWGRVRRRVSRVPFELVESVEQRNRIVRIRV